ncbi:MAG TPA: TrmH family RNA methyltransferase [Treponemataceae bacterium]|nr:TrmH family RNA methyltransferase [Treponemataceae bacterium]
MIEPGKIFHLTGGQRRRKLALTFGALERDIAGVAEKGNEYSFASISRIEYTKKLTKLVIEDPKISPEAKAVLEKLVQEKPFDELRTCNYARNQLLQIIGSFPAEWDLIIAPHDSERRKKGRDFYSGIIVYAEDIRSPFNLGSIFRTAEAMGAEKILLSPLCTDPNHPRAQRSAMGCINYLPWERCALENLPTDVPVFVLETGGVLLENFLFPKKGIVIIGSEELGVSPEALKRANNNCVTISMKGVKASLNVGVAFGVLMQAWVTSLT